MNETQIFLVKRCGDAMTTTAIVLSRNPCIITAHLTALLLEYPGAHISEETSKTPTTPTTWGVYMSIIKVNVEVPDGDG